MNNHGSIARHHAEWLSLLDISGPFLSLPVLLRAFPQGLDGLDADLKATFKQVYEEWQAGHDDPAIHRAWVEWLLRNLLGMPDRVLRHTPDDLTPFATTLAEYGETLKPDFAIVDPRAQDAPRPRLLVQVVPRQQDLDKPLARHRGWVASPATRMMTLLHAADVRLGLMTNGEQWMLVDAPKGETTGFISWYAELWRDEELTLRAFRSLLNVSRFFGVATAETIEHLLAESVQNQQDVTDQLGYQVRRAVEVLVQAIDRADRDAGHALLAEVADTVLYEAALTVMMRLVFLLSAEERDMLLLGDDVYDRYYAVSTLRVLLREIADQSGEEILERRYGAWSRLLATFRAVYGGIRHDRLTLPAYGGSLFDPDRFPFLEGRSEGTGWERTPANPLPINDRTVLHLLDALQMLQMKLPGGGPSEARRLSFRALDIEQIGHVYEGLLDHTAMRADGSVLGLGGAKYQEPEIRLTVLEEKRARGEDALLDFLKEETGRSLNALRKDLRATPEPRRAAQLRVACDNDEALFQRILPFAGLIRDDSYGQPMVIPAGSVYVTQGSERRATGTHYTPRSLTEPIVQHTLEPLVYKGPADGWPRDKWELRPASELLDLKVCDMAMGSGAFLVQTCRYLAERVVEAWQQPEKRYAPGRAAKDRGRKTSRTSSVLMLDIHGVPTDNADSAIPADSPERLAYARRLVADRCLYGVDRNPLAVEMAKLSLWLVTLDKGRAFTFLDHALKCGDSLVGVSLDQLIHWNLDLSARREFATETIRQAVDEVVALRGQIEATTVREIADQRRKEQLFAEAEAKTHDLRVGADLLVGSYFNNLSPAAQAELRRDLLYAFRDGQDVPAYQRRHADLGTLKPFHWQLEFPEVFLVDGRGGFDAIVGNPPFLGGKRISTVTGEKYHIYLKTKWKHTRGSADLCAYFFLRAFENLKQGAAFGLIATNSIAQGDTREVGLDYLVSQGAFIYNAVNNHPWPGAAAVAVDVVHISRALPGLQPVLDGQPTEYISSLLDSRHVYGSPHPLAANAGKGHMGSNVVGVGFTIEPAAAEALIAKDLRNREALFPYLNGEDLNSSPSQQPSRWIVNFFDWPLTRAELYPDLMAIVRERVFPERKDKPGNYSRLWWQYGRRQERLYDAVFGLRRVLVTALTSKYLSFTFVEPGWVYAHACGVFAFETADKFAILQSVHHEAWARKYGSTLETRLRYTPADVFETFPFPGKPRNQDAVSIIGETYHEHRRQVMLARQDGLTATYNRFHNPEETAADIARLRELHVEMDQVVAAAYGWDDFNLGHGFHETQQSVRFTISESARREVLARLLQLNHERYAEEVKAGLHVKGKKAAGARGKAGGETAKPTDGRAGDTPVQTTIFGED